MFCETADDEDCSVGLYMFVVRRERMTKHFYVSPIYVYMQTDADCS